MAEATTGSAPPAVLARRLRVHRGRTEVIGGVDLAVSAGEWVAIIGPNGAGKTTMLHVLGGLLGGRVGVGGTTVTGVVSVGGLDPRSATRRAMARQVALVPQRPVVPPGCSVADLVGLGRTPHIGRWGVMTRQDRQVVAGALARFALDGLATRDASTLSGGELQRVILARAVVQQPRILLLDEPTSGLDIGYQQSVLDLVATLRGEEGLSVVAAMHDLTLAGQYADRLVLLNAGRVVADGPPHEVLRAEFLTTVYGARVSILDTVDGPVVMPVRGLDLTAPAAAGG